MAIEEVGIDSYRGRGSQPEGNGDSGRGENHRVMQRPSHLVMIFPTRKLDGNVGGNGIMDVHPEGVQVEKDIQCPSRRHDDSRAPGPRVRPAMHGPVPTPVLG